MTGFTLIFSLQTTVRVSTAIGTRLCSEMSTCAPHSRSVLCNASHLTEDDGEIYMNTGVVELYNSLKDKMNNIQIQQK